MTVSQPILLKNQWPLARDKEGFNRTDLDFDGECIYVNLLTTLDAQEFFRREGFLQSIHKPIELPILCLLISISSENVKLGQSLALNTTTINISNQSLKVAYQSRVLQSIIFAYIFSLSSLMETVNQVDRTLSQYMTTLRLVHLPSV